VLWILDTLHQVLLVIGLYTYVVGDYGIIVALTTPAWFLLAALVVSTTTAMIVRTLYGHRVWKLGRNLYITTAIIVLSSIEFAATIVWAILASNLDDFQAFTQISAVFYLAFCAAILADALIASSQVVMLWRLRTGFKRTDSIVRTLMLYSINTGLLTSVMVIVCLITFATMPDDLIYVAIYHIVSGLLLNALLATYNARPELRSIGNGGGEPLTISFADNQGQSSMPTCQPIRPCNSNQARQARTIEISVVTATNAKFDAMGGLSNSRSSSSLSV